MRKFYIIEPHTDDNPYEVVCFLANNMKGMQILLEANFAYSQGLDIRLYSIDGKDSKQFEEILSAHSYKYISHDLNSAYEEWKSSNSNKKEELDDKFIDASSIQIVGEYNFSEIRETENGTQILTEEEICRKDCIKIYTHSNENCGHHIPHIHVSYNNDRNYCVISLKDRSVLQPINYNSAKVKKALQLLNEHFDEAVEAWNRTTGHCKL